MTWILNIKVCVSWLAEDVFYSLPQNPPCRADTQSTNYQLYGNRRFIATIKQPTNGHCPERNESCPPLQPYFCNIHSNTYIPSMLKIWSCPLLSDSRTNKLYVFVVFSECATCPAHECSLSRVIQQYLARRTHNEAAYYANCSNLLLLLLLCANVLHSAMSPNILCLFLPLMREIKFFC